MEWKVTDEWKAKPVQYRPGQDARQFRGPDAAELPGAHARPIYPDHTSAVYEGRVFTWSQTYARCRRFASYLARRNIGPGDTVAAMLPNIPAMNEVHFAVPMAGAVLNALNIRLDAASIAFQLDHGGARIILVDPEFASVIAEALTLMKGAEAVRHRCRR